MKASLATALLVGATLSSLIFSTAPAFAESNGNGGGNTPVTFCHNGTLITTDDDGEIHGHRTAKGTHGIHINDVFSEDIGGRLVTREDCMSSVAVEVTAAPTPPTESEPIVKGETPVSPVPVPDHAEPNPETPATVADPEPVTAYPAPSVTPNTVNGVVPASANPTPAPTSSVTPAATATDRLANTGANDMLLIWGAVGLLALLAGLASVIYVRRKAA